MSDKTIQGNSNRKKRFIRLGAVFLALFAIYVSFGVWGVPAILKSQLQSKGSEALGREVTLERATFNPFTFETRIYELAVAQEGEGELLSIERIAANPQVVSVLGDVILKSVEISDGAFSATIEESGHFAFQDVIDQVMSLGSDEAPPEEDESIFGIRVETLRIDRLTVDFEDRSLGTPYSERMTLKTLVGTDVGTLRRENLDTEGGSQYHWDFEGQLAIGSGGELSLSGGALGIDPWVVETRTELSGFPMESVQPYVSETLLAQVSGIFGFEFSSTVDLTDSENPKLLANGRVSLDTFTLQDDARGYIAFERLSVEEIDANLGDLEIGVGSVTLRAPVVNAVLDESGKPVLPDFVQSDESNEQSETSEALRFAFELGVLNIENGQVVATDRSLESPFETRIQNLELSVNEIAVRQSEGPLQAQARLDLALEALGGSVQVTSDLLSLESGGELAVEVNGVQLTAVQPYVASLAHAEIEDGLFSTQLAVAVSPDFSLRVTGGSELAQLKVSQTSENEQDLVEFAMLKIDGIDWNGEALRVESVGLESPKLTVWQDESGMNFERLAKGAETPEEEDSEIEEPPSEVPTLPVTIDKFTLEKGAVEYRDTTLVSTYQTRLTDIQFAASGLTTIPEKVADFEFGLRVDGGGRFSGSGRVNVADPSQEADLQVRVEGYDMTGLSPFWETYLARRLAKGQFAIVSNYEVRGNQLSGSNSFRIEDLTLGERVESESAMTGLPIGFAIKLLQGPGGVISYDGLSVQGDLSEPEVSVAGLIGKAVGNLIAKAVTSPFTFLSGLVGGKEDLDQILFEIGSAELSEEARQNVDALGVILEKRPGLRLDVEANPSVNEERAYLKKRYVAHVIANPGFSPVSGLDLLKPYDQSAYQEALPQAYQAATSDVSDTAVPEGGPAASASPSQEAPTEEAGEAQADSNRGVFARISRFLGFGGKGESETASAEPTGVEAASEAAQVDSSAKATSESEEIALSDEEMFSYLVEEFPDDVVQGQWIEDLSAARIQSFKTQLFANEGVDSSRVFVSNVSGGSATSEKSGDLIVTLSE